MFEEMGVVMKRLFRGIFVLFFMVMHCSSHLEPVTVAFPLSTESYFNHIITLTMQVWANVSDVTTLMMSSGDETLGKLLRLQWHLDQLINTHEIVYHEDKQYFLTVVDHLGQMVRQLHERVSSELPIIFETLLVDIQQKAKEIQGF